MKLTIISGGQYGVDVAALFAARQVGLKTGGVAPKGWRTQFGANPKLAEFGLREHKFPGYEHRTKENVKNSDGTLLLVGGQLGPGTKQTMRFANHCGKPTHLVNIYSCYTSTQWFLGELAGAESFIRNQSLSVLNVAGSRDEVWILQLHNWRAGDREDSATVQSAAFDFLVALFTRIVEGG